MIRSAVINDNRLKTFNTSIYTINAEKCFSVSFGFPWVNLIRKFKTDLEASFIHVPCIWWARHPVQRYPGKKCFVRFQNFFGSKFWNLTIHFTPESSIWTLFTFLLVANSLSLIYILWRNYCFFLCGLNSVKRVVNNFKALMKICKIL